MNKLIYLSQDDGEENQSNDIKDKFRLVKIIRQEHPNCAIYKKTVSTIEEELMRTTLFTPKKRISMDVSKQDNDIRRYYVSKEKHLETLLFYLKDIKVSLNDTYIISNIKDVEEDEIVVGVMSLTPYTEMLERWCSKEEYKKLCESKVYASCIRQLKRIIKEEIEISIEASKKYSITHFTFSDQIEPITREAFEKHYYPYYKEASKSIEGGKIGVLLEDEQEKYDDVFNNKHIQFAILR